MKKFLSALFIFVFLFTVVSCGEMPGGNPNQPGGKDDKIVVTFWHAMGQENQVIIESMIESFEEKYPEVDVQQANQGGYPDLLGKIKDNIKAGAGPVLAQTYPDHVTSYLSAKDAVVDLNKYAWDDELGFETYGIDPDLYIESFWAENTVYDTEGSMYSLPFNKSTEIVFYNQDIFARYNWFVDLLGYKAEDVYSDVANKVFKDEFIWQPTWQELVKIGEAYKGTAEYAANIKNKISTAAFSYDSEANLFITLTQQLAALDANDTYGEKGEFAYTKSTGSSLGEFTFLNENNPYAREAVSFYKEYYDKGYFATASTLGAKYSSDAFKDGACVVTIGSSAGAKHNNPGSEGFQVGVGTYPQWEGTSADEYQVIQQGTNLTLFTQLDKEVEKYGWLFILHVIDFQQAYDWCTGTSYFPIRTDVYESQDYQDFVSGKIEVNGETKYMPTLGAKAAKVGWMQRDWFYTNATFAGSDISREEVGSLVAAVLLNESSLDKAFADCKDHLKNYIIK